MSSSGDLDGLGPQLVAQWPLQVSALYATVCVSTLVFYDYLITFPMEIKEIWQRKLNISKVLFILNRYTYLIFQLVTIVNTFWRANDTGCNALTHLDAALIIISPTIATTLIFALRTYAIYGKNIFIGILIGILGLGVMVTNIWEAIYTNAVALPKQFQVGPYTCYYFSPNSAANWFLSNYILGAVFDTVVFILTVAKTIRLVIQSRKAFAKSKSTNSLSYLLLRDGIVYYSIQLTLSVTTATVTGVSQYSNNSLLQLAESVLSLLLNGIGWIVVNRLMLNLKQMSHDQDHTQDYSFTTITGLPEPYFAANSFLGNLGAPLRTTDDEFEIGWESYDSNASSDSGGEGVTKKEGVADVELEMRIISEGASSSHINSTGPSFRKASNV